MAKILFSGVAGVDMRNKLNGSVFSKNRYGGYVRTKVTPVNPQTDAQQNARNRLSTFSQAWRGLTESQRQGWIDAAPNFPFTDIYGNTKVLSGQALYVKFNCNLALIDIPQIDDAPSPVAIPAITSVSLAADASTPSLDLTFAPTPTPADFSFAIFATPQVTPGKMFVKNQFRFLQKLASGNPSPDALVTPYTAMFGDLVAGQKIFMRIHNISEITGQAGIPVQTMTIVVP